MLSADRPATAAPPPVDPGRYRAKRRAIGESPARGRRTPPGLHHHGPLGEQPVNVGSEITIWNDLWHRARHLPQIGVELTAGVAPDVAALLVGAESTVIALTHCSDSAVQCEDASLAGHRRDHRVAARTGITGTSRGRPGARVVEP